MKIALRGSLQYGDKDLHVDISLEMEPTTALIGPNLTGKSLALQCIHRHAKERYGRDLGWAPVGVFCEVSEEDYVSIYLDVYRTVNQLYERALSSRISSMKRIIDSLKGYEEIRGVAVDLDTDLRVMARLLEGDREMAGELKEAVDDRLLFEAMGELDALKAQFQRAAEKLRETGHIFEEYFPLELSVTKAGFNWRDSRIGAKGYGLTTLSSAFSPAMVVLFATYAYAVPERTYLLVEEPEAHAHPLLAFFIGRYLRRLTERAGGRFNVVASTHSLDFVRGLRGRVYVLSREQEGERWVLRVIKEWRGEGIVPGFSDPALYELVGEL